MEPCAPEEGMFRDATRIGQITAGETSSRDSAVVAEALSYFDRAAATRIARESLIQLAETSLSHLAAEAEKALAGQDAQALRDLALTLMDVARKDATSPESALAEQIRGQLALAASIAARRCALASAEALKA
jgi:hypothetical protein